MSEKQSYSVDVSAADDCVSWDIEIIVEQVWKDLHGVTGRSTIEQVVSEVIQKYQNAQITTFIPILVHKEAVDRLRTGLTATAREVYGNEHND